MNFKKKKLIGLITSAVVLIGIIFFVLNKPVPRDKWFELEPGMALHEVEETIGRPKSEYVDERNMLDVVNLDYQHYQGFQNNAMTGAVPGNAIQDLVDQIDEELYVLDIIHNSILAGDDIRVFEYEVEASDGVNYEFVYFYRNELLHYSGYVVHQLEDK